MSNSLQPFVLGGAFIVVGVAIIVFHDRFRRMSQKYNRLILGELWTGHYTRGGLIALRVISILFGGFLLVEGVLIIGRFVD